MTKYILVFLFSALAFWFSQRAHAASAPLGYPTATGIRLFKQNLDLNGQVSILSGTVDPTSTATSAPIGSLYLNTSTGVTYRKLDAGSTTNWALATTGAIAQASYFGGMEQVGAAGGTCDFIESTSTGLSNFVSLGTGTGCSAWTTSGSVAAVAANDSRLTLNNMGIGSYKIDMIGNFHGNAANCVFRLTDGTNNYQAQVAGTSTFQSTLSFQIDSATPGTRTYQLQAADDGTSCLIPNDTAGFNLAYKVYYFPTQAQTVLTPALTPAYAGKQWLGATAANITVGGSAAATTTRTTLSSASLSTYTLLGSAQNDASTNIQVTATLPAGEYEVEFNGLMRAVSSASGSQTNCVYELWDGTTVVGSNTSSSTAQAAINVQDQPSLRGYFKLSGTTTKTISVRAAKTAGDTSANSLCQSYVSNAAADGALAMLTIAPRTQSVPMPVIANSVITSSAGVERVERATVTPTSASVCTVNSQSGSWISGTTPNSTGDCTLTFAVPFSGTPTCTVSVTEASAQTTLISSHPYALSGSSLRFVSSYVASGSSTVGPDNSPVSIICQGPK